MKTQPPLWIFSPFGQPSYCTTSSHSPFGSMRKTRPKGMSTHHRFPSRSNDGPSRKLSTCAAPRLGSDQAVRRFLRNFAGSEVKGRAWMRLIFWKGLCTEKLREGQSLLEGAKHNPTRRNGGSRPRRLFLHSLLDRILDVLDLVDLDVEQPAADFFDAADINRLDDVARLRVDRHRTARALPLRAFRGRDERVAVGLAA